MADRHLPRFAPGTSVLGGAASGLSYEGCLRDAVAREERALRRESAQEGGRRRAPPPPRSQSPRQEPAAAQEMRL